MACRQKFNEEEEENKKVEDKFEKKKMIAEIEEERREKQKEIRDTFKSILIDDNEIDPAENSKNLMQGKLDHTS